MRAAHQRNGVRRKRAEVALQEREEPFRSLSASSPVGIFLTDTAGRCTYTNPRCQAICGFSFDEGLGLGWERFVYPEDREAVTKAWAACTREGREYSGEFRFQTPQGIVRWVHARTSPMLSEQGTLIGHVGTLEEITERKRAELLEQDRNSVLEMIARNEPLGDVLTRLAEMIERTLPDAIGSVLLLRDGHLYHGAAPSLPDSFVQAVDGLEIGPQAGSCGTAAYRGETVIVREVASDPLWERFRDLAATYELRACWSVPILSGEEQVLGTFATYYREPREPGGFERELLDLAARLASVAIEHDRLVAAVERRAAEALAVAEVGRAITASLDPRAVLDLIVSQACRLLGTGRCGLAIVEPEESEAIYRFVARRGLSERFPERMRPRHWRDGSTAMAIKTRQAVWSADILNDPALPLTPPTRAAAEAEGYRSVLSVPLLTGDGVLGALVVYRDSIGSFSSDEVDLLRVLADHAAIAIENARLFQQEQERRRQLEAIREVMAEITRELDLTTALDLIIRRALELVGAAGGTVFLLDETGETVVPQAWSGVGDWMSKLRVRLGEGITGQVVERGEGMIVDDYRAWPQAIPFVLENIKSTAVLSEPIRYQDRVIGAITVNHQTRGPVFTEQNRQMLELFAAEAAVAIENARLYRELTQREQRLHDLVGRLLLAQEDERHRVAYEVHDGLAQVAAAAQQHLEAFASACRPRSPLARQQLQLARELARRTVGEARRVIAGLRPTALDDFGLATAIRMEVEALRADGWQVTYEEDLGGERLPPTIETALYRVAQEALENMRKHAETTRAHVALRLRGQSVLLEARDWGCGFRPSSVLANAGPSKRVGLVGMQERISWLGGRCTVHSRPGAGTRIVGEVPLPRPSGGAPNGG